MFLIDQMILLTAVLILLGIASSKLSARLGLPVLVLFLLVGMLAGDSGLGGISFDNPGAAHALGTLALALILFDGGLQTPTASIKKVWKPASLLATVGVLVTALVTGVAAAYVLDLPIMEGLLLGAIVGSTDAAAVFSLLRNAGIHIRQRLKATLEIESASNDPMAIFLTVGLLEILVNGMEPGVGLLQMFVLQMGVGAAVGLGVGWASVQIINRIHLAASGLYPVMVAACGLLAFGLAANLNGSGFLAIFLAGVVIGNSRFVFQRSTFLFHDGLAWLSQITMFVVLGLLINPPSLLELELTESMLLHDSEASILLLQRLKNLGVKLAIDDFGTGYPNLSYLQRFQVDRLKIDRSFVQAIIDNQQDRAIVTAIIQMARSLHLHTTAEGIEDEPTRRVLAELGCDCGQGYLFSRPLTALAFQFWSR